MKTRKFIAVLIATMSLCSTSVSASILFDDDSPTYPVHGPRRSPKPQSPIAISYDKGFQQIIVTFIQPYKNLEIEVYFNGALVEYQNIQDANSNEAYNFFAEEQGLYEIVIYQDKKIVATKYLDVE